MNDAQDNQTREERLAARVQEIARRACAWMESNGKTLNWMVRTFDPLGSAKTLRDMRDGKAEGYDLETQLANYEAAWSLIQARDPSTRAETVIRTLTGVVQIRRAVLETIPSVGNDRVILLIGDSGIGKTCALRSLSDQYDGSVYVEALEVWGDAPGAMLSDILAALGERSGGTQGAAALFRLAVNRLCKRRVTLLVDEAHELGRRCLNTLKGLVNATPGEFVLAGQTTLWQKLQCEAYVELRQLTTNRLHEKITLKLNLTDVEAYIAARFPELPAAGRQAAARIAFERAGELGNMSFVRDVCTSAARKSETPAAPDQDAWVKAEAVTAARK